MLIEQPGVKSERCVDLPMVLLNAVPMVPPSREDVVPDEVLVMYPGVGAELGGEVDAQSIQVYMGIYNSEAGR
jgi:hypothetical protein